MAVGHWIAARLSDGGGDDTLYATRDDAALRQLHSGYHAYVRIEPNGMGPRSAFAFLRMARHLRSNGQRFDIPGCFPILPQRSELRRSLLQWGTHR